MKPNGMRAWRLQARRWRRKQNRANRRTGAPWISDGTGRWYRRQRAFFEQRPVLPTREFSARSLCGMSMGARKRAARICPGCIECRNAIPEIDFGLRCDSSGVFAQSPEQWRRRYKIGQRLRPCPGCAECARSMVRQLIGWARLAHVRLHAWKRIAEEPCNGFTGRWMAGWTVHLRNGDRIGGAWRDDDLRTAREIGAQHCLNGLHKALGSAPRCDGSGVLPARERQ